MSFADIVTIAPFVAAILLSGAILLVDFVFPGRRTPALITTFAGTASDRRSVKNALSALRRAGFVWPPRH